MSGPGEIQRAELFANVDELMEWKKSFELKQTQLMEWQKKVMTLFGLVQDEVIALKEELATTIQGCGVLVECDTKISDRIDIVNKRIRHLEEAVGRLTPR